MRRNIITVPIRKVSDASVAPAQDLLAVEEPLQIRVGERNVAITMRTPGNDAELAAGFLLSEGILERASQISAIKVGPRNVITLTLAGDADIDLDRLERHFYLTSSCGVCGKASIEALESIGCPVLPRDRPRIELSVIHRLPEMLRTKQMVFDKTGGLH